MISSFPTCKKEEAVWNDFEQFQGDSKGSVISISLAFSAKLISEMQKMLYLTITCDRVKSEAIFLLGMHPGATYAWKKNWNISVINWTNFRAISRKVASRFTVFVSSCLKYKSQLYLLIILSSHVLSHFFITFCVLQTFLTVESMECACITVHVLDGKEKYFPAH